jgi:hypothetical protein
MPCQQHHLVVGSRLLPGWLASVVVEARGGGIRGGSGCPCRRALSHHHDPSATSFNRLPSGLLHANAARPPECVSRVYPLFVLSAPGSGLIALPGPSNSLLAAIIAVGLDVAASIQALLRLGVVRAGSAAQPPGRGFPKGCSGKRGGTSIALARTFFSGRWVPKISAYISAPIQQSKRVIP